MCGPLTADSVRQGEVCDHNTGKTAKAGAFFLNLLLLFKFIGRSGYLCSGASSTPSTCGEQLAVTVWRLQGPLCFVNHIPFLRNLVLRSLIFHDFFCCCCRPFFKILWKVARQELFSLSLVVLLTERSAVMRFSDTVHPVSPLRPGRNGCASGFF